MLALHEGHSSHSPPDDPSHPPTIAITVVQSSTVVDVAPAETDADRTEDFVFPNLTSAFGAERCCSWDRLVVLG